MIEEQCRCAGKDVKKAVLEAATVIKGGVSGHCSLMLSGPTSEVQREVSLGSSSSSGFEKCSTSTWQ